MPEYPRPLVRPRRGINLIELLGALALSGILLAMGAPRLSSIRDKGAVRSAKQQLNSYLVAARSAAMRSGVAASFHVTGDTIWVTSESTTGASQSVAAPLVLSSASMPLTVTSPVTYVRFNSRGFATNLDGNKVFRVVRAGYSDSVCVSRLGNVSSLCGF